jgi:glyoxylase-like metal-dependent hydrolase (beta-lactamase superfamily II)
MTSAYYNLAYRPFLLGIGLCLSISGHAAQTSGQLVNPQAASAEWHLPTNVIDTRELPQFSFAAENRADAPLPVYRLTDNTYFLFGNIATLDENNRGFNGNAGFVITNAGVVVIDALGTPQLGKRMIATIRTITDKPIKYLIITHNHPDHAYGAAAFQALDGITVIAHPGIVEYNNSSTMEESVAYRRERLPEDMQGFAPPQAGKLVEKPLFESLHIELGGQRFNIYNTGRHHSYGDLVVHQPDAGILWISDLAFNQRTTFMGDGSSQQIIKAQTWLLDNFPDAQLMVPGHGSPQGKPFPMVEKTRNYVERLRKEMKQAVEKGVPLYDAVQNSHFEDWQDSRLYEGNHRANASFVYREMEKEYFDNF